VRWIDTHCHLNDPKAFPNVDDDVARLAEREIGVIIIGVDPESSERAVEIADRHANAWAVVGRHPNYTASYDSSELERYAVLLRHPKVVALGEIGLDWHWDYATPEQQYRALREQMALALDAAVPVVLHCREAYDDLMEEFASMTALPQMIFHCFAGEERHARHAVQMGCYFGVDGPVTYPKSEDLRRMLRETLPRDRVIIETDSPYLSPVPYRGKPNHPNYVTLVSDEIARCWGVDAEEAARQTTANAIACFRLNLS